MPGFSGFAFFVAVFGGRCYFIFMAAAFVAGHSNSFLCKLLFVFLIAFRFLMQSVSGLSVTAQALPPAINMGFGAIRADGSRVSTFVFQCCFCSGWTNFVGL